MGVSTVGTNSIRKGAEFDGILDYGNVSISSVKRNVMNKDEALRIKSSLIYSAVNKSLVPIIIFISQFPNKSLPNIIWI